MSNIHARVGWKANNIANVEERKFCRRQIYFFCLSWSESSSAPKPSKTSVLDSLTTVRSSYVAKFGLRFPGRKIKLLPDFVPTVAFFVLVFKIFAAAIVNTFITSNFLHKFLQITTKWLLLRRPFLQSNTRTLNRGREPEISWDAFRSRIAKLWFPYYRTVAIDRRGSQTIAGDRTWFYLLRSSAITIAGSQTIAEVCFHMIADDRRPYCDLRSAIRDHMETSLYVLSSAIVCDRDRRIADDRRPYCDLRSAIRDHMETSL